MTIHGKFYPHIVYFIMSRDLYNFMTYADPKVTAPPAEYFGEYFMGLFRGHVQVLYDVRITKIALQIIKSQLINMNILAIDMVLKEKYLVIEKKILWNMIVHIEHNKKFHYYHNKKLKVFYLDKYLSFVTL